MKCDEQHKTPTTKIDAASVATDSCSPKVIMETSQACQTSSYALVGEFIEDLGPLLGLILITAGSVITFFGAYWQKLFMLVTSAAAVTAYILVIEYSFIVPSFAPNWWHYAAWGVAIAIGTIVGLMAAVYINMGLILVGFALGTTGAFIVYDAFLIHIFEHEDAQAYALWAIIIFSSVCCAILTYYIYKHMLVLASAIIGGFCLMRGFSIFAGGYPNEFLIYSEIKYGTVSSLPSSFYMYMGLMAFFSLCGILFQERNILCKKKKGDKYGGDDEEKQGLLK